MDPAISSILEAASGGQVGGEGPPAWTNVPFVDPQTGDFGAAIIVGKAGTLSVWAGGGASPKELVFVEQEGGNQPRPIPLETDVTFRASFGDAIVYLFKKGVDPGFFRVSWGLQGNDRSG
ncbi:MAG TPA: hypothetical protein VFY69_11085 [Solirubrobacterales bacterium]|nr:hypothetical protein [Solirubrobacterales bacterium]